MMITCTAPGAVNFTIVHIDVEYMPDIDEDFDCSEGL